jgi:hypothetical protein
MQITKVGLIHAHSYPVNPGDPYCKASARWVTPMSGAANAGKRCASVLFLPVLKVSMRAIARGKVMSGPGYR